MSGRTNNDPFTGAFFGQVTTGDGFLKWKGISRLTWDYNNFGLTTAARYFDGFREQRANNLLWREGETPNWSRTGRRRALDPPAWFWDGQLSYNLVFTQPVEQHPVAGYSKDGKEVKSGKDKEVVQQAVAMPCWKTLLNNTNFTIGCNNMLGADPPKAFGASKVIPTTILAASTTTLAGSGMWSWSRSSRTGHFNSTEGQRLGTVAPFVYSPPVGMMYTAFQRRSVNAGAPITVKLHVIGQGL